MRRLPGAFSVSLRHCCFAVTLADGTDDAENLTISPSFAKEGQTVTVTYTVKKKIKSIKAIKE